MESTRAYCCPIGITRCDRGDTLTLSHEGRHGRHGRLQFDLGFSTSIPVPQFDPANIFFIEDTNAPHDGGKIPTEKIMTDGCGFMNGAALIHIAQHLQLPTWPTTVQGRIAGAKGVWLLHPTDRLSTAPPRIWIRDSQNKIKLPAPAALDRAHLIFDLVGPARLSAEPAVDAAYSEHVV
ncbi:hypothetical protein DENSPDRAFT_882495 [Dentipellis sp. KUC8613]|nr:hypothetical protein DENSPDRAFT_882495 [Dentipellis sp. KUC8613]